MKAITICQPYPRLILLGEKPVENRSWGIRYRGPLLIHAGVSRVWLADGDEEDAAAAGDPLIFGAIVGRCRIADCLPVGEICAGMYDAKYPQLISRAHCNGPWCWVLVDIEQCQVPIPWRGKQGFFNVPDNIVAGVEFRRVS